MYKEAASSSTSAMDNSITSLPDLPPFKTPSDSQTNDLQHLSTLLHLLHHRNHNQHRRSTWYRHFNLFRRHLNNFLLQITKLKRIPDTNLGRHRKKASDAKLETEIRQRMAFWRDVLVPKAQHAFSQLTADGRFAVLGVTLLAILGSVARIVGLLGVYEELGEEETRKVLEQFAAEGWGEQEGLGVLVSRKPEKTVEDLGEVVTRNDDSDDEAEKDVSAAKKTEKELRLKESECLAPERKILQQSLEALKPTPTASPSPSIESEEKTLDSASLDKKPVKAARKDKAATLTAVTSSKDATPVKDKKSLTMETKKIKKKRGKEDDAAIPLKKKKKKKNAIDELFNF